MNLGQTVGFFAGMIAIIFAAYYVTYFIGKKAQGQSLGRLRNKHINLIDRFAVSKDKSFCLIEIAGKVYIVGITNHTMTLLDTLDAAAFSEAAAMQNTEQNAMSMPIPGGKYTVALTNKLADFIAKKTGRPPPEAEPRFEAEPFSDSMKAAREKKPPEQPRDTKAERADNPEEL